MIDSERLLQRFLRYVVIETTADETVSDYPSSPGQRELGALLAKELIAMGAGDVQHDEHGLVWAALPASPGCEDAPAIAFNAHLDTSPDASAHQVKPQVVRRYAGGDIPLPGESARAIRVAESPDLANMLGKTLITSDGTTLLGGDDKAGVAIIMEIAQHLLEEPHQSHGPLRVLFTCDEEIGRGVQHVDIAKLGAAAAYTFDGGGANKIDVENFSAIVAVVDVQGVAIHPSMGKDRLVNALRVAAHLVNSLPGELSPEHTQGREGFMHPYVMEGSAGRATVRILLRNFDTPQLDHYAQRLRELAAQTTLKYPGAGIELEFREQYRNMADGLTADPRVVDLAQRAHENLGRDSQRTMVRGGTDGAMLTAKGLPTPNLSSGQHHIHSPLEWACLDEMRQAAEIGAELLRLWGLER